VSILSDFEDNVSRAVEGMFAGVFRSPVQPAELAKALAKRMDRDRSVGVGKVYAPNLYTVLLSPADDAKLGAFADTLADELSTFLTNHANERGYELPSRPLVRFLVDDELKLGKYEVYAELVSAEGVEAEMAEYGEDFSAASTPKRAEEWDAEPARRPAAAPIASGAPATPGSKPATAVVPGASVPATAGVGGPPRIATVTVTGVDHDVVLRGERFVVGRLKTCDISLPDANVSREHAAFEPDGPGWAVVDLGSTNGTVVNGRRVARQTLTDGDVVTVGITELVYHGPRVS